MNTTEINSWLDVLRSGNDEAREKIIEHSCERLRMLCRRMLRSYSRLRRWEETDDILQQAMIRLHSSLSDVQPESMRHFLALAATQIRRTLIDVARHHYGPLGRSAKHESDGGECIVGAADISGEPITLEDWTEFHEVVAGLPDNEKEVFHLLWFDGLNRIEAAKVIGVNEKTVRRRWNSARVLIVENMHGRVPE